MNDIIKNNIWTRLEEIQKGLEFSRECFINWCIEVNIKRILEPRDWDQLPHISDKATMEAYKAQFSDLFDSLTKGNMVVVSKKKLQKIKTLVNNCPRCCLDEKHYCARGVWVGTLRKAVGGEPPYTEPSEYRTLGY